MNGEMPTEENSLTPFWKIIWRKTYLFCKNRVKDMHEVNVFH